MNNFLEELKAYLDSSSNETVLKDWSVSAIESDSSILVEDFIEGHYSFNFTTAPPNGETEWLPNNFTNLKETSGFCFL